MIEFEIKEIYKAVLIIGCKPCNLVVAGSGVGIKFSDGVYSCAVTRINYG